MPEKQSTISEFLRPKSKDVPSWLENDHAAIEELAMKQIMSSTKKALKKSEA